MNLRLPSLPDKESLKRFVPDIFRNLFVIYIILLVFSFISPGYVEFYIDLNNFIYPLIVLGAASLLFYAERLESSDRNRFYVAKKRISYAFLGLLFIIAVQSIAPQPALEGVKTPLMVAAVALGAVTFYLNKDKLGEIEDEARQEDIEEKRREMEFAVKYPKVNKVWGVRWAARWMYREGWWYSSILLLVTIISFGFMVYGLGNFLTIDEPRWINVWDRAPSIPSSYEEAFDDKFIDGSYARSVGYWDAYFSGDIGATLNNANPSATVNFLHLLGYFFENTKIETYLFLSRIPFVLHNLFFIWIIYFLIKKSFSRDAALLFFVLMALNPLFIGYSRIVNHDSLIGLYIISFIISYWIALETFSKKYFLLSGVFYAFTHLTNYKGTFLFPLLFIMPIFYYYINYSKVSHNFFGKCISGFKFIIIGAIVTSILLLPAVTLYPQFLYTQILAFPHMVQTTLLSVSLFMLFLLFANRCDRLILFLNRFESRLIPISFIFIFGLSIYNIFVVYYTNINIYNHDYLLFREAIQLTFFNFFVSLQPILLILIIIYSIVYFKNSKIDFSYIFFVLFFILLILAVLVSNSVGTYPKFKTIDGRYLLVFLPIFISSISIGVFRANLNANMFKKFGNTNIKKCAFFILIISLSYSSLATSPYYTHYTNAMTPDGYLSYGSWGLGGYEAAEYLNKISKGQDIVVYDSRNIVKKFLNRGQALGWTEKFWGKNPDYLVIYYEKTHRYKEELDKYKNITPEFEITLNGAQLVGVYKYIHELHKPSR